MIPITKLAKLAPRHRMRKAALVLSEIERKLLFSPETELSIQPYCQGLAKLLVENDAPAVRAAALELTRVIRGTELTRAVDSLRHALFAATGQAPADWDLLDPSTGLPDPSSRTVSPGRKAFLEDLRSPFNVGSIFRTADAFGVEELLLSPSCADPLHPRAQRSAMGAVGLMAWKRAALESLAAETSVFALELGGEPIDTFSFPEKGIAVLGSEELGLSRQARDYCTCGTVSIPMAGAKGSLNVAVAFGILMNAWRFRDSVL